MSLRACHCFIDSFIWMGCLGRVCSLNCLRPLRMGGGGGVYVSPSTYLLCARRFFNRAISASFVAFSFSILRRTSRSWAICSSIIRISSSMAAVSRHACSMEGAISSSRSLRNSSEVMSFSESGLMLLIMFGRGWDIEGDCSGISRKVRRGGGSAFLN